MYYPTQWRRHVGKLASSEDKKFRWFMCAKKYFDPATGVKVIELAPGTQFYSITTGRHYVVPVPPEKEWKTKLLLTKGRDLALFNNAVDAGLQGIAYTEECSVSDISALCMEAGFVFHPHAVQPSSSIDDCAMVAYAKANYTCIKAKIDSFPSPDEIDEVLKSKPCDLVCRVLYGYIDEYLQTSTQ